MSKMRLTNGCLGAFMMSAVPSMAADCLPNEPIAREDMRLPIEISLSSDQHIHSMEIVHGCTIDFSAGTSNATNEKETSVLLTPAEWKAQSRDEIGQAYMCGFALALRDGQKDIPTLTNTTYVFQNVPESQADHQVKVSVYPGEILSLGNAFLQKEGAAACTAVSDEYIMEFMDRHGNMMAPVFLSTPTYR